MNKARAWKRAKRNQCTYAIVHASCDEEEEAWQSDEKKRRVTKGGSR
jgi:hypothetical protein